MMRTFIDDGAITFDGEFFSYKGLFTFARPVQEHLPLKMGAMRGPKSFQVAAEFSDGCHQALGYTPEAYQYMYDNMKIGADRAGKNVDDLDIGAWMVFAVGEDSEIAKQAASSMVGDLRLVDAEEQLQRNGVSADDMAPVLAALGAGDLPGAFEATRPEIAEKLSIAGTPAEVVPMLKEIVPHRRQPHDPGHHGRRPGEGVHRPGDRGVADVNTQLRLVHDKVMPAFAWTAAGPEAGADHSSRAGAHESSRRAEPYCTGIIGTGGWSARGRPDRRPDRSRGTAPPRCPRSRPAARSPPTASPTRSRTTSSAGRGVLDAASRRLGHPTPPARRNPKRRSGCRHRAESEPATSPYFAEQGDERRRGRSADARSRSRCHVSPGDRPSPVSPPSERGLGDDPDVVGAEEEDAVDPPHHDVVDQPGRGDVRARRRSWAGPRRRRGHGITAEEPVQRLVVGVRGVQARRRLARRRGEQDAGGAARGGDAGSGERERQRDRQDRASRARDRAGRDVDASCP